MEVGNHVRVNLKDDAVLGNFLCAIPITFLASKIAQGVFSILRLPRESRHVITRPGWQRLVLSRS